MMEYRQGWILDGGETWDVESPDVPEDVDLISLDVGVPAVLTLTFRMNQERIRRVEFAGLASFELSGEMYPDAPEDGWEVMGTGMVRAPSPRDDGRVVYLLEVPGWSICFASLAGCWVGDDRL